MTEFGHGVHLSKSPRVILCKQIAECTCCLEPRIIARASDGQEWGHVVTGTYADTYHVHEDYASSDCDGPMYHTRTVRIADYRSVSDAYDLWKLMVEFAMSSHGYDVTVKIQNPMYGSGEQKAFISEVTDEGGKSIELVGCDRPECAHDSYSQRDVFAEAMGY